MAHPKIGNMAPAFSLKDQNGDTVSLKDYKGKKNVLLYFYPKAKTPGCTVQALGIRDSHKDFAKLDTVVLAVSPDPVAKLKKFEESPQKEQAPLNFTLLSDEDHAIADKYGAWGPKKFMGREFDGILRSSFVVGKDGRLKYIMDKVKTKTHDQDILDVIKSLDLE